MFSQICLRASMSSCEVWGATQRHLMDQNIWCPGGVLPGLGRVAVTAFTLYQFLHPPGLVCILLPHEARHCFASGGTQDELHQRRVWPWVLAFHPDTWWLSDCRSLACRGRATRCWAVSTGQTTRPDRRHHHVSDKWGRDIHTRGPQEVIL